MKVAIVGSRSLKIENIGDYIPSGTTEIISGGAKGIDTCAREFALKNSLKLTEFLPDYTHYGRRAPLLRNIEIVKNADIILIFWDGKSRGTFFTLQKARSMGKAFRLIYPDGSPLS